MSVAIRDIAYEFVQAVTDARFKPHERLTILRQFPAGCCKPASLLLGKLLVDKLDVPNLTYVAGDRSLMANGYETHFWIEVDTKILDVTAIQFDEIDEIVFFSQDRTWHDTWSQKQLTYTEGMLFNTRYEEEFNRTYQHLIQLLDT